MGFYYNLIYILYWVHLWLKQTLGCQQSHLCYLLSHSSSNSHLVLWILIYKYILNLFSLHLSSYNCLSSCFHLFLQHYSNILLTNFIISHHPFLFASLGLTDPAYPSLSLLYLLAMASLNYHWLSNHRWGVRYSNKEDGFDLGNRIMNNQREE